MLKEQSKKSIQFNVLKEFNVEIFAAVIFLFYLILSYLF